MRTKKMQQNERAWHAGKYEQFHSKDCQHTQTIRVLFRISLEQLGLCRHVQNYADTRPGEHVIDCVVFMYIPKIIQMLNQVLD